MSDEPRRSRRSRWIGLAWLSIARLRTRATTISTGRLFATVCVVGLTIALLLLVTGVALALADDGIATHDDADVRIVPHDESTLSAVDGVERSRLGDTTERTERIRSTAGVDHATPVLVETIQVQPPGRDDPQRVLAVGIVPGDEPATVAGLPTDELDGEGVVLSEAAGAQLEASAADEVVVTTTVGGEDPETWTVASVEHSAADSDTDVPVVLVSLDELQAITGAGHGDLADRVLVWGDDDSAAAASEEAYPYATIETTSSVDPETLFGDGLALATSAIALVVGVAVCSLVVATTAGLAVDEDRRTLAILAAVGFSTSSRLSVVAITTLVTTAGGALVGIALGVGGIVAVNELAGAIIDSGPVVRVHPIFVPYAFGVALLSGLLAVPYPMAVAIRTNVLEEVGR